MLEMKEGCFVKACELLNEEYQVFDNYILANVNTSKIEDVLNHYIVMHEGKTMFFILEIPANENEELKLRKSDTDPFHRNIYYIDGLDTEHALLLIIRYGKLLINDGFCNFGFGVQDNSSEIMSDEYNVIKIWSENIDDYKDFFDAHNISETNKCRTAWDTFSLDTPGECKLIKVNGIDIYDLPKELSEWGIYFAEQREE